MVVEKSFSKHGHGVALVHLLSRYYIPAAYPECRRQNTSAISRKVDAHALAVIPGYLSCPHNKLTQARSRSAECQVVRKFYLHSACAPRGFALNYSVKNIRNDVQRKIIIIFYEKSQFDSLVWGSLTLTPIIFVKYYGFMCTLHTSVPVCVSSTRTKRVRNLNWFAMSSFESPRLKAHFADLRWRMVYQRCTLNWPSTITEQDYSGPDW